MLYNSRNPVLFIPVLYTQTVISDFLGKGLIIFRTSTAALHSGDVVIKHLICQVLALLVFGKIRGRVKGVMYLASIHSPVSFSFFLPFKCSYTELKCFVIMTVIYTKRLWIAVFVLRVLK